MARHHLCVSKLERHSAMDAVLECARFNTRIDRRLVNWSDVPRARARTRLACMHTPQASNEKEYLALASAYGPGDRRSHARTHTRLVSEATVGKRSKPSVADAPVAPTCKLVSSAARTFAEASCFRALSIHAIVRCHSASSASKLTSAASRSTAVRFKSSRGNPSSEMSAASMPSAA